MNQNHHLKNRDSGVGMGGYETHTKIQNAFLSYESEMLPPKTRQTGRLLHFKKTSFL